MWFTIYFIQPHPDEIAAIQHETIHVRVLKKDGFALPMLRFGSTNMMFEMSFDPTLYQDARALDIIKSNNLLTITLVNSLNSVVKALRYCIFPLKFMQECTELWSRAYLKSGYSTDYRAWYLKMQQFPVDSDSQY